VGYNLLPLDGSYFFSVPEEHHFTSIPVLGPKYPKGNITNMENIFNLNPDELILYRAQPSRKWYVLAWRIVVGLIEVAVFILFSFTAFTDLAKALLVTFLPVNFADALSRIIFQGIAPLGVIAWFAEDIARIFSSELILTNQRVWTKGAPYAWTAGRETPLSDIKSMSSRRDALFIHLKSTRKTQVYALPDGKQIVKVFLQFTGKTDSS
jgi:hypothetical protein